MTRLALFGGTFDPPHWGHIALAHAAQREAHLDRVIWVPSATPPHKSSHTLTPFSHRLALVQRAIAPYATFEVTDAEARYPGPSYAADTWLTLRNQAPKGEWFWIIGLDTWRSLPRWHRLEQFADQCCWLIAPRPSTPPPNSPAGSPPSSPGSRPSLPTLDALILADVQQTIEQTAAAVLQRLPAHAHLRWRILTTSLPAISSQTVRSHYRHGHDPNDLIPSTVAHYIRHHDLYSSWCSSPIHES